jgi:hypothetical protein
MYDEQTPKDRAKYLKDAPPITRRRSGELTAGPGLAAALPSVANAQRLQVLFEQALTLSGEA